MTPPTRSGAPVSRAERDSAAWLVFRNRGRPAGRIRPAALFGQLTAPARVDPDDAAPEALLAGDGAMAAAAMQEHHDTSAPVLVRAHTAMREADQRAGERPAPHARPEAEHPPPAGADTPRADLQP